MGRANQLLDAIAGCGRHFFRHDNQVSRLMFDRQQRICFWDAYTKRHIYPVNGRRWRGFTEGGTLRRLVQHLVVFVRHGTPVPFRNSFGPWHQDFCGGDVWGYGEDMEKVRQAAIDLGLVEKPTAQAA